MNIYNNIVNNNPCCFVRINDGEVSAIISDKALASRGDEQSSPELSEKLLYILSDTWSSPNLFIGVPCNNCYRDCFNFVKNELIKSKDYSFIQNNTMDANILINSNYDKTLDILMTYLSDRKVIIVSNKTIINNIDRLSRLNIQIIKTYTVSPTLAFRNDYHKLKDLIFENESVIITLCGPLGRVLCYEWFKNNQTLTCLDLGSFFDPLLRNKAYLYHTNNHRYCPTCYPTADPRFTKIFEFCTEHVDKECYYLATYHDHINLYNKDYNRIILNTRIRLEKDPYNYDLHKIMTNCKIQLFTQNSNQSVVTDNFGYSKIIELCKNKNPIKILEIGFGGTTILFLENTNAYVTSIDVIDVNIDYLQKEYNNRLTYIKGISTEIVPSLSDIYNIIYINSIDYNRTLTNIVNCYYKSTSETILIVNGIIRSKKYQDNLDIINAYDKCIFEKLIVSFYEQDFEYNKGLAAAKYNWSNDMQIRYNNILLKYMGNYNYIISLIDTSKENDIKKITTYIEETKLLQFKKDSYEGYAFQVPSQFEDLMNICHSKEYNNILDIGFLHGSSSLMFLMNTSADVISIDNNVNKISEQYIVKKFPDRFKIVHGNSKEVLYSLVRENIIFDLIYIDGGHGYSVVKDDLDVCQHLISKDSIIVMNDVVNEPDLCMCWNDGPTKVYNEINKLELFSKTYHRGRGLVAFQMTPNESVSKTVLGMNKTDMYNEIIKLIDLQSNRKDIISKINILSSTYLKYFSIVMNNEEYNQMKYYYTTSLDSMLELEKFIAENNLSDNIKDMSIDYINKYYNQQYENTNSVPKIVHFVYINQRPLRHFNYKCIYSVLRNMPEYQVYIHNDIEPDTEEWKNLKKNDNVIIKKVDRIKEFDNYPVSHVQYEADIIRMDVLYEYGGIYLDTDIYIVKNIESLLDAHSFYIAKETETNFINCVIISEPKNEFVKIWLEHFATGFRIGVWGWHIRDLPKLLLDKYPHYITKYNIKILDYENFCPIHWTQGHIFNDPNYKLTEKTYGIHLFETIFGESLDNSVIVNY